MTRKPRRYLIYEAPAAALLLVTWQSQLLPDLEPIGALLDFEYTYIQHQRNDSKHLGEFQEFCEAA